MENHRVYTEQEAEDLGINYVYWRNADKHSKYVLTDDKRVVPILRHYLMGRGHEEVWLTPFGRFSKRKKRLIDADEYEERKNAFWTGKRTGILTHGKKLFVYWYLRTGDKVEAVKRSFPNSKPKNAKLYASQLLAKREVKEYMASQFKDMLEELGITEKYILEKFKDIVEDEDETGSTKINALKELSEYLEMKKKVQEERIAGVLLDPDQIKALNAEKQKQLKAKDEEEIEEAEIIDDTTDDEVSES